MDSLVIRWAVSLVLSSAISARAYKRRSLDLSGAIVGFAVMAIHIAVGYRFGAMLLVFFFTSSKLTKVGEEKKRSIDEGFKEGGQRNWLQVLANSAIATILVIAIATIGGQDRCLDTKESALITGLIGGIMGHYACCNGDTWSSEIGMLSNAQPRLITNFKKVRKGTNGAVTIEGLAAAAAGGSVIGLTCLLVGMVTANCATANVAWRQLLLVPMALAAGLLGSLIDSLLGATLQFSGYCSLRKKVVGKGGAPSVKRISGMNILDNNGVNAVSVLLMTLLTCAACSYIF